MERKQSVHQNQFSKILTATYKSLNEQQNEDILQWIITRKFIIPNMQILKDIQEMSQFANEISYYLIIEYQQHLQITNLVTKQQSTFLLNNLNSWTINSTVSIDLKNMTLIKQRKINDSIKSIIVSKIQYFSTKAISVEYNCKVSNIGQIKEQYQRLQQDQYDFLQLKKVKSLTRLIRKDSLEKELIDMISKITHLSEQQLLIYYCSKLLVPLYQRFETQSLKDLTNKVISLDRSLYNQIYPLTNFLITPKIDGLHGLLINLKIETQRYFLFLLTDESIIFKQESTIQEVFILECEITPQTIYLIDILLPMNYSKVRQITTQRINELSLYQNILTEILTKLEYICLIKPYKEISDQTVIKQEIQNILNFPTEINRPNLQLDGIIFVSKDTTYQRNQIYKWKSPTQSTIDFLLVLNETIPNKNEYILLTTVTYDTYLGMNYTILNSYSKIFQELNITKKNKSSDRIPIHFQPLIKLTGKEHIYNHPIESENLHLSVVEMIWKNMSWEIVKIRTDKSTNALQGISYGNHHYVAEQIWNYIMNPLQLNDLWNYDISGYFGKGKELAYEKITNYHSQVKNYLFEKYCNSPNWVLDIASGKGQDLWRYRNCRVKNIVFNDSDILALNQLIQRRYKIKQLEADNIMKTYIVPGDITVQSTAQHLKSIIKDNSLELIVCNFAVHYIMNHLKELIVLWKQLLKKNGLIILTYLNGQQIHKLFTENQIKNGEDFTFQEESRTKFIIRRLYDSNTLLDFGQRIGVKLPFQESLIVEDLVNEEYLITIFKEKGFNLIASDDFFSLGEKVLNTELATLQDIDQNYTALHNYAIFQLSAKDEIITK